jgi:hypothetical protein
MGGLTVNHHHGLLCYFITSSKYWNVYDQNETCMLIHIAIKKALEECMFKQKYYMKKQTRAIIFA